MKVLMLLVLSLLAGCASGAGSAGSAPPSPVASATPSPTAPLRIQVDASDFVEWGQGGGIDGRWSGVRVWGDGRVTRSENLQERQDRIEPSQAARLLQAAADAGILALQDHPPTGADMLGRGIQAELDGRKVAVSMDEMTRDPAWDKVWAVLKLP